jgi:thymidylate synthase (FAD)
MVLETQSVKLLTPFSELSLFNLFGKILNVPYAKGDYDEEKVKQVLCNCVRRGHLSVLEHVSLTLQCRTNIGTYKDYTRHRHCAFTVESTSFVNYAKSDIPIIVATGPDFDDMTPGGASIIGHIKDIVTAVPPKIARDWLPQCLAATMIMTTNIREWRYIIGLRGDPNDNPLTLDLRNKMWKALNKEYPFFFPLDTTTTTDMTIYNEFGDHSIAILHD